MPKREDIQHILIIGAGPIVIGQACEFDYSGTQACKALMLEGYQVTLINSNPATIMTDMQTAHNVYIEPITPQAIEAIIEKEKPDAILPTVGGQTALNCCMALHRLGVLEKYNIEILGAKPDVIDCAEDRQKFNEIIKKIGLETPKNAVVSSVEDALYVLEKIGLPVIIRPSFTLGGAGGGIAHTHEEFLSIVEEGIQISPTNEILIDESVLGWKEYEMEVIRDCRDNCIIVCSIENIDPMGVHTGDSITVAPAQTLTDKEYQNMRNASIAILRAIGIETGGSNVQFAVNPENGRMLVIEMNPRVSRSSALASKATGFPIAKVAAKLAVGYSLDEIQNDITKVTPASFEPSIDYIVTKIPRFAFEKFKGTSETLSSSMRSVGEVMAIGRTFEESLQKALCSLEKDLTGLNEQTTSGDDPAKYTVAQLEKILSTLLPNRLLLAADAIRAGFSLQKLQQITQYDLWFLRGIQKIVNQEQHLTRMLEAGKKNPLSGFELHHLKKMGFSDARIASLSNHGESHIRELRHQLGVRPVFKKIDTCAAEFESCTPYLYSTYEGDGFTPPDCESEPSSRKKVVILGSGPNRIGQGLEFDYACTHAAIAVSESGFESIMINCNPETVSTDYDTSDKLYFEPLTLECVSEILYKEQLSGELLGVIVQLGGQTPLKLSAGLQAMGFPIIGTSPDSIHLAEDRESFKNLLNSLGLKQPPNDTCHCFDEIENAIKKVGYPVIIRPSNVLGGRAMEILRLPSDLKHYIHQNQHEMAKNGGSILVDKFLEDAMEIDVDAICDGQAVYVAGVMEHIEKAGVHSGDSTSVIPTRKVSQDMLRQIQDSIKCLAVALKVVGLMNVQYAIQENTLYILEVNPRASRTVPFVSKATGMPIASLATRLMLGEKMSDLNLKPVVLDHFAVKDVVFPFARFAVEDIQLRPEMQSTGEVMGIAKNFHNAFYKSQVAAGYDLKMIKAVLINFGAKHLDAAKMLIDRLLLIHFHVYVPSHIYQVLGDQYRGKIVELSFTEVLRKIKSGSIHLLLDIATAHLEAKEIRRAAFFHKIAHATTLEMADAMVESLEKASGEENVSSIQSFFPELKSP